MLNELSGALTTGRTRHSAWAVRPTSWVKPLRKGSKSTDTEYCVACEYCVCWFLVASELIECLFSLAALVEPYIASIPHDVICALLLCTEYIGGIPGMSFSVYGVRSVCKMEVQGQEFHLHIDLY